MEEPSKDGMTHLVLKAFSCFKGTILYVFPHDKQKKMEINLSFPATDVDC